MRALFTHGQPTSGYQSTTSHGEEYLRYCVNLNLNGHNTAKAKKTMICSTSVVRLNAVRF